MYLITTLFQSAQNTTEMPQDFINRVLPKEIILKFVFKKFFFKF